MLYWIIGQFFKQIWSHFSGLRPKNRPEAAWNYTFFYNPGQNIWHKLKKYIKIGQDFKNVISNFACFLTAIVNV